MASEVDLKVLRGAVFLLFVFGVGGLCPKDWIEHGTSCYKIDNVKRPWAEGAAYCHQQGGQLLVIETREENIFIQGMLKQKETQWAWLGCSDIATEGTWRCYREAECGLPAFQNWDSGQPNNNSNDHCMSFNKDDGQWSDSICAEAKYIVCETAPKSCYTLGPDGRLQM